MSDFEFDHDHEEASRTLREVFGHEFEFSRKKPMFRLMDRKTGKCRCFYGTAPEIMKNTRFLDSFGKFRNIVASIESHKDKKHLMKLWIKEYDKIIEMADLVEIPYNRDYFEDGHILSQDEIDAMLSGI